MLDIDPGTSIVNTGISTLLNVVTSTQILEEAGESVKLSDLHKMSVQEVRDKAKEILKLIEDWKISYARTTAQTALTMVMSHHSEMEIWHVTKDIAEEDDEGN